MARLMVGCAALVCGAPSWWGVLCWCLAPLMVGRLCCCLLAVVVVRGEVVLGLGCCRVCRLAAGIVGFGLVVLVVVF